MNQVNRKKKKYVLHYNIIKVWVPLINVQYSASKKKRKWNYPSRRGFSDANTAGSWWDSESYWYCWGDAALPIMIPVVAHIRMYSRTAGTGDTSGPPSKGLERPTWFRKHLQLRHVDTHQVNMNHPGETLLIHLNGDGGILVLIWSEKNKKVGFSVVDWAQIAVMGYTHVTWGSVEVTLATNISCPHTRSSKQNNCNGGLTVRCNVSVYCLWNKSVLQ